MAISKNQSTHDNYVYAFRTVLAGKEMKSAADIKDTAEFSNVAYRWMVANGYPSNFSTVVRKLDGWISEAKTASGVAFDFGSKVSTPRVAKVG